MKFERKTVIEELKNGFVLVEVKCGDSTFKQTLTSTEWKKYKLTEKLVDDGADYEVLYELLDLVDEDAYSRGNYNGYQEGREDF